MSQKPTARQSKILSVVVGVGLFTTAAWFIFQSGLIRSSSLSGLAATTRSAPLLSFDAVTGIHLLYTMPLAAAAVVFARMVIGIKTFGLFTPMLMAMAFLQTGPIAGPIILFVAILSGLLIAPYLKRLKMARVGFLAGLMSIVALVLIAAMPYLDRGEWVTAFPVVVTALAVERWWTVWEGEGLWEAAKIALGTLVVAFAIEILVISRPVYWLVEQSPFAAAAAGGVLGLTFGLYRGLRLSELTRFKVVRKNS